MKYILAIVLLLVIGTIIFVMAPERTFEAGKPSETSAIEQESESISTTDTAEMVAADQRHTAMLAEYEKLEKARRNLDRQLARLKAILWGVMLPREQAAEITEQMKTGYALLKNKRLLGAYYNLSEITSELGQVRFIYNKLKDIEQTVREIKEQNKKPEKQN